MEEEEEEGGGIRQSHNLALKKKCTFVALLLQ